MMAVRPLLHEMSVLSSRGRSDHSPAQSRFATIPGAQAISVARSTRCASRLIGSDEPVNVGVNISITDSPIEPGPLSITLILPKIPKNTPLLNTNTGHNPAAVTYLTLEYHLNLWYYVLIILVATCGFRSCSAWLRRPHRAYRRIWRTIPHAQPASELHAHAPPCFKGHLKPAS